MAASGFFLVLRLRTTRDATAGTKLAFGDHAPGIGGGEIIAIAIAIWVMGAKPGG